MENYVLNECPQCGSLAVLEAVPFPLTGDERLSTQCSECEALLTIEVHIEFRVGLSNGG